MCVFFVCVNSPVCVYVCEYISVCVHRVRVSQCFSPLSRSPETGDGAGHLGDGVREGREALSAHVQTGTPHQGPQAQAHNLLQVLPGKVSWHQHPRPLCPTKYCILGK